MKLGHYVEIVPIASLPGAPKYRINYVVSHQSFGVNGEFDTLEQAVWYRDQLLHAMRVMVSEVTDS